MRSVSWGLLGSFLEYYRYSQLAPCAVFVLEQGKPAGFVVLVEAGVAGGIPALWSDRWKQFNVSSKGIIYSKKYC
jgi:hypothetical protein